MVGSEDATGIARTTIHFDIRRDRPCLIVMAGGSVGEMYPVEGKRVVIGRGQRADVRVLDEGISREHARVVLDGGQAFVEDLGSTNGTYCNGVKVDRRELCDGDKILIGTTTVLKFTYHDQVDESFQRLMYESALRDGLTKAFNRKYLLDRLESEFAYAVRHRTPLSLVLFDLDEFKTVNDRFGHQVGDRVLVELAQRLSSSLRTEDVFARYGGEEFAVVCRGIDLPTAEVVAERLRATTAARPFGADDCLIPLTISLGVAGLPCASVKDAAGLIGAADRALYQAKQAGRDRVCAASG